MNTKKVSKVLKKLLKITSKHKLTPEETVLLFGNLMLLIGGVFDETNKDSSYEALCNKHENKPSLSTFLMLTGTNISACVDDIRKQQQQTVFVPKTGLPDEQVQQVKQQETGEEK